MVLINKQKQKYIVLKLSPFLMKASIPFLSQDFSQTDKCHSFNNSTSNLSIKYQISIQIVLNYKTNWIIIDILFK